MKERFVIKLEKHRSTEIRIGREWGMLKILRKQSAWVWLGTIFVAAVALAMPPRLAAAEQMTTVHVQVNDAATGDPIFQAHLTLRYRVAGGFMRHTRIISYTAKTDKNGKGQFPVVPRGTITLMVTAPDHNTFGKEFEITKDNQLIEVKLQKPHEVL